MSIFSKVSGTGALRRWLRATMNRFALSRSHRVGATVTVHYDPGAPDRSVIVTGITWHHFMLPLFALVILPFALLAKALTDARAARAAHGMWRS